MTARPSTLAGHGGEVRGTDRSKQLRRLRIVSSAVLAAGTTEDATVFTAASNGVVRPLEQASDANCNATSDAGTAARTDAAESEEAAVASRGGSSSSSTGRGIKCARLRYAERSARDLWRQLFTLGRTFTGGNALTADATSLTVLARTLTNATQRLRLAAAKSLASWGAVGAASVVGAEDSLAGLTLAAVIDRHAIVREVATEALGYYGKFDSTRSGVDIRQLTKTQELLRTLTHIALEDDAWPVRAAALRSLGQLAAAKQLQGSAHAAEIASTAAALLVDDAWQVRWRATETLQTTGHAAADHTEALLEALSDSVWQVRHGAASALAASTDSTATYGLVIALQSDKDHRVREAAASALGSSQCIASHASGASALAAALTTEHNLAVRVAAVRGLSALGSAATPHAATLARLLQGCDASFRLAVRDFFSKATGLFATSFSATFGPAGSKDTELHAEVARQAREALQAISPLAAAVRPSAERFANQLLSDFQEAQLEAEECIQALGATAVPCMVERVAQARDGNYRARMAAMRGLSCTGVLSHDLACAFLAEWIYQPLLESLPVFGLELVVLQTPQEDLGINLQWAVLRGTRGTFQGQCFLVYRGSETALDWTENSYTALKGVEVPRWGVLLLHSGFWSSVEGERDRLSAALEKAAEGMSIEALVLCGGSKGGANALATAALLMAPRLGQLKAAFKELVVVTFGAPNIAGRGSDAQGSTSALNHLRETLRQKAPRSRSWAFTEDPVVALMSRSSGAVLDEYGQGAWAQRAIKLLQYFSPDAYRKAKGYFEQTVKVTRTLEPMLPEESLVPPPAVRTKKKSRFDVSVHPQLNYTEALCRRMLGQDAE